MDGRDSTSGNAAERGLLRELVAVETGASGQATPQPGAVKPPSK